MSPANNLVLKFDTSGKSFIYYENKSGPSVEPCGTLQVTGVKFDVVPGTEANWIILCE